MSQSPAEELAALQAKFAAWKEKTKTAVDAQRAQIVELQAKVVAIELERDRLAQAPRREPTPIDDRNARSNHYETLLLQLQEGERRLHHVQDESLQWSLLLVSCVASSRRVGAAMSASSAATIAAAPKVPVTGASSGASAPADFEKWRQRNERALAMASGQVEELTKEVDALKRREFDLRDQLDESRTTLTTRDRAFAALASQLQEATSTVLRLQSELDLERETRAQTEATWRNMQRSRQGGGAKSETSGVGGTTPSRAAGEGNHDESQSFTDGGLKESALQTEIDRLKITIDVLAEENHALCQQLVSSTSAATLLVSRTGGAPPAGIGKRGEQQPQQHNSASSATAVEHDPYVDELLDQLKRAEADRDGAQRTLASTQAALQKLEAKMAATSGSSSQSTHHSGTTAAAHTSSVLNHSHPTVSSAPESATIPELQRHLTATTEKLWESQKQLTHVQAALAHAHQDRATRDQHAQYAKDVVVKLLAAPNDVVRGQLLPVLTSVMGLSTQEQSTIQSAHPTWVVPAGSGRR